MSNIHLWRAVGLEGVGWGQSNHPPPPSSSLCPGPNKPREPEGCSHYGPEDLPINPVEEKEDRCQHHRLRHLLEGQLVPCVHVGSVRQDPGAGADLDAEEPAQVLVGVLPEVEAQEVLRGRAPSNLLVETLILLLAGRGGHQAAPPVRVHRALEYEAAPEHDGHVVLVVQPRPACAQHPLHGPPCQPVELLDEDAPRQAMDGAVQQVRGPRESYPPEAKPLHGPLPRLVRAPVEDDDLDVGAHLDDRPVQALDPVESDGVDPAPRRVGRQLLGPQVGQDLEVVVGPVHVPWPPLVSGYVRHGPDPGSPELLVGVPVEEERVEDPGSPAPVLGPRPVLRREVVPDVGQELLAVVRVHVDAAEVLGHRPSPRLGVAGNHDLEPRPVHGQGRVAAPGLPLVRPAPEAAPLEKPQDNKVDVHEARHLQATAAAAEVSPARGSHIFPTP
mmetsp:Transcript_94773/g.296407  ORF Transcript_94773/g.296407 Transcript_94773/m.296407 type:complete len:444 (-) Transcript_94773:77-1408(-)